MDEETVQAVARRRRARMRRLAQWRWRIRQDRHCRHCGRVMENATLARLYCGDACRSAAYRWRRHALTLEQMKAARYRRGLMPTLEVARGFPG
jgi:hypothetical protein